MPELARSVVIDRTCAAFHPYIVARSMARTVGRRERLPRYRQGREPRGFNPIVGVNESEKAVTLKIFMRQTKDALQRVRRTENMPVLVVQHDDVGSLFGHQAIFVFGLLTLCLCDDLLGHVMVH